MTRTAETPALLAVRQTVLRRHERISGTDVEHGNQWHGENRKGASHRKARPKVEIRDAGAEISVVVMSQV